MLVFDNDGIEKSFHPALQPSLKRPVTPRPVRCLPQAWFLRGFVVFGMWFLKSCHPVRKGVRDYEKYGYHQDHFEKDLW